MEKQWFGKTVRGNAAVIPEVLPMPKITAFLNRHKIPPGEFQVIPTDSRMVYYLLYYAEKELE